MVHRTHNRQPLPLGLLQELQTVSCPPLSAHPGSLLAYEDIYGNWEQPQSN
jgi:hypothetical protein